MNQNEQRLYLITLLLEENKLLNGITIPGDVPSQIELFETLLTMREPSGGTIEFQAAEREYLKTQLEEEGIEQVSPEAISMTTKPIYLIEADAIVNWADPSLLGSFTPGVNSMDNKIHLRSGVKLRVECADLMQKERYLLSPGEIRITDGHALPCKKIIHVVAPAKKRYPSDSDFNVEREIIRRTLEKAYSENIKTLALSPIYSKEALLEECKAFVVGKDISIAIA